MDLYKKLELESLIYKLLNETNEIGIRKIAEAAPLSIASPADRRAIQRALNHLTNNKIIQAQGKARARVYMLNAGPGVLENTKDNEFFNGIHLSEKSAELVQYFSKAIHTRAPVGYNQDFLRSYEPNKTAYLSRDLRLELLMAGRVENLIQPAGTYARNIINRLLIDLSWNSSRLEGNTYSLLDTQRLIEFGENAIGKDAGDAQMILNHKDAIEYIIESAEDDKISAHQICSI